MIRFYTKTPEPRKIKVRPATSYNSKSPSGVSTFRKNISPYRSQYTQVAKTQPIPIIRNSLLSKIRSRNQNSAQVPSPVLAKLALKVYFLPYFQEKLKIDTDKQRFLRYGNTKKSPIEKRYIKLSDILKEKLNRATIQLEKLKETLNKVNQEKNQILLEFDSKKKFFLDFSANKNCFFISKNVSEKIISKNSQALESLKKITLKSEKLFKKKTKERVLLLKTLTIEKFSNLSLKNSSKQSRF